MNFHAKAGLRGGKSALGSWTDL